MTLTQVSRFLNDAAAIEKTLRLLQGIAQILAAYSTTSQSFSTWTLCRRQFALGRRFLRFGRWVGCLEKAVGGGEMGWLGRMKWGCMGGYLGCESLGILDVMGVYPSPLAQRLLIEGHKFWFFALLISLLISFLQLSSIFLHEPPLSSEKTRKWSEIEKEAVMRKRKIVRRKIMRAFVKDVGDLLVPGYVLGWVGVSGTTSAVVGVVSSVVSIEEIWQGCR